MNAELEDILNNVYNYVSIVDKNGYVVFVNDAIKRYGKKKNDVQGKNIQQLLDEGYMSQSVVRLCMEKGKAQAIVQHDADGDYLNWASPHFNNNGEIEYVVCTEWDLAHLNQMQDVLIFENALTVDENKELEYYREKNHNAEEIIYESPAMDQVIKLANQVADTDTPILIQGESGVGKELIMRYIHEKSKRFKAPLMEVNCSAIPEQLIESELFGYVKGAFTGADDKGKKGLFELANNGTLFLDEIGELPLKSQGKLLRALQNQCIMRVGSTKSIKVNPRIIAATNVDIESAVKRKQFRLDLYYRLNVVPILVPPLRNRTEDIGMLTMYFNEQYNRKYKKNITFTPMAISIMEKYKWPGNVRELRNLIERIHIMFPSMEISDDMMLDFLPGVQSQDSCQQKRELNLSKAVEAYEKDLIISMMRRYENLRQFSDLLGVEKTTMHRKLKKYGIVTGKEK